jgi:hypothetical protein
VVVNEIDSLKQYSYDNSEYDPELHKPVEGLVERPYRSGYCWMVELNDGKMPTLDQVRQGFFNILRLYLSEKKLGREWS